MNTIKVVPFMNESSIVEYMNKDMIMMDENVLRFLPEVYRFSPT
jgi:hypothetical protein